MTIAAMMKYPKAKGNNVAKNIYSSKYIFYFALIIIILQSSASEERNQVKTYVRLVFLF
jgi:hypothetical protein